jgi:hypothetical protein
MMNDLKTCYLCGQDLDIDVNDDHVPPKQFHGSNLRKLFNLNLLTLATHTKCNKSYEKDEVYFLNSIGPLATDTQSGRAIWIDIAKQMKREQGIRIGEKIFKEFTQHHNGVYVPNSKVLKQYDRTRISRVIWKIVRGLFFEEFNRFLPEDTPWSFEILSEDEEPPKYSYYVLNSESKGRYPGIFDYKYVESDIGNLHMWGLLFWDKIITIVYFHDPNCDCEKCTRNM